MKIFCFGDFFLGTGQTNIQTYGHTDFPPKIGKGASIKEVFSDVEVGRKQKFEIWGDFQDLSES